MSAQSQTGEGGQTPRYRLLADHFFAPMRVEKGSIIESDCHPNANMEPLNDAAWDRMEAWYAEETQAADDKGGKLFDSSGKPVMIKHHEGYRVKRYEAAEAPSVNVIAPPPKGDMTGQLDLGRAQFSQPTPGDLRPPPDVSRGAASANAMFSKSPSNLLPPSDGTKLVPSNGGPSKG